MASTYIELPVVSGGGGGGGISSLNGQTGSTQSFTTGTSGTNFSVVSLADIHTLNLPVASGTNTGKLSNTDWTTFNSKEPAITNLPIAKGGTNSGTALNNNRVMQSNAGAVVESAAITSARALISDANGIPTHSTVTSTALAFLDATSSVQTQFNARLVAANNLSDVSSANTSRNNINKGTFGLTDGANIAVNCNNGNIFTVTLGGNRTLDNPTNQVAGATYMFIITQDGTGSRTLAYGSVYKFPSAIAPILTTNANAIDMMSFVSNGTNMLCTGYNYDIR